ncbi:MAG TPA: hypothetical protein VNW54_12615 [Granulicella sp.]|nr:hypothetical protein [Granulicella sp.]
MPFGNDRHLMAWLFDKAINSDSSFVTIRSASDYLRETGKKRNGDLSAGHSHCNSLENPHLGSKAGDLALWPQWCVNGPSSSSLLGVCRLPAS